MKYRVNRITGDKVSEIGLGTAYKFDDAADGVRALRLAYEGGINIFDLGAGHADIFPLYGEALFDVRSSVFYQIHFSATYPEGGYAWSIDYDEIARSVELVLKETKSDYIDYGFISCIDEIADWEQFKANGVYDRILQMKGEGLVRHVALSSHTPATAQAILDEIDAELFMFSINPAYDFGAGGDYARGDIDEREALIARCEKEGLGISVMKPFSGGQLLSADASPFGVALSNYQCIQYALDKPAVLTVLPGVQNSAEVESLLAFHDSPSEERDYSVLGTLAPADIAGRCVYCNHCKPCPMGIEIGLVNKYYDLARIGDDMAAEHYRTLELNASDCIACGHCDDRCPFGVRQSARMAEIAAYMG